MVRKVDTFEIEKKSKNVFEGIFTSWIHVEQQPDMEHIDYRVVIRQDMEPTGKMFAVQLKGQEKVEIKNEFLKFRGFEVKHLKYYIDKVIDPVYLFVVDINNSKCYYLFLQKWLKEGIKRKKWRQQSTTTIKIPIKNILKSESEFIPDAISAINYMRELRPSTLRSSFKSVSSRIKEIDSNIDLETRINNDSEIHILKPKSDFNLELNIPDEIIKSKFQQFVESGKSIEFNTKDISFSGQELFKALSENYIDGKLIIRKHPIESEVSLVTITESNEPSIFSINGKIYWGSNYCTFEGSSVDNLILLSFKFTITENLQIKDVLINFNLKQWEKNKLLDLHFFDSMYALLSNINKNKKVFLICNANRKELFKGDLLLQSNKSHINIHSTIELLWKCREISKFYNINPTIKSFEQLKSNSRNIEIFYSVMKTGSFTEECDGYSVKLPIHFLEGSQQKIESLYDTNNDFMIESKSKEELFFEESILIGELIHVYLNWKLIKVIEPESSDDASRLLIKGHSESKLDIFVKPDK